MTTARDAIRRQRRSKRRRPTRRSRWTVGLLAAGAVLALCGVAFAAREFVLTPWLCVSDFSVRGAERLTAADIQRRLQQERGKPILLVDLDRARARLEESAGIREARVARRLPNTLEAVVIERRAVARALLGGREFLVDEAGMIFHAARTLPGDDRLPEMRGLTTPAGEARLWPVDLPGVEALLVLARALGGPPPDGTTVDLTLKDRIVIRPGPTAPLLWLDRRQPERNLRNLIHWQNRVAELGPDAPVDLRFAHRLILAPPPAAAGAAME